MDAICDKVATVQKDTAKIYLRNKFPQLIRPVPVDLVQYLHANKLLKKQASIQRGFPVTEVLAYLSAHVPHHVLGDLMALLKGPFGKIIHGIQDGGHEFI